MLRLMCARLCIDTHTHTAGKLFWTTFKYVFSYHFLFCCLSCLLGFRFRAASVPSIWGSTVSCHLFADEFIQYRSDMLLLISKTSCMFATFTCICKMCCFVVNVVNVESHLNGRRHKVSSQNKITLYVSVISTRDTKNVQNIHFYKHRAL